MPSKLRPRKPIGVPDKPKSQSNAPERISEIDSTSGPGSGTSFSSSDESKSEKESVQRERKRKLTKKQVIPAGTFHTYIWVTLILAFWILDIGVHLLKIQFPIELSSFSKATVVDWMYISYSFVVPFCFYKLWESSPSRISSTVMLPALVVLTIGACMQTVIGTVTRRLQAFGYDSEWSVGENSVMQFVKPTQLVDVFEMLITLGLNSGFHLWWISFLLTLLFYFFGCFIKKTSKLPEGIQQLRQTSWSMLPLFAVYFWYMVSQYQLLTPFLLTLFVMLVYQLFQQSLHRITDENGQFLLQSMGIAVVFLVTWKWLLCRDEALSELYPGIFGIPKPWTYVRMYIHNDIGHLRDVIRNEPMETTAEASSPILSVTIPTSNQ
ncbi:ceroid-lipofuscinosis neuronal protein 6 homolog [Glandiceps talaboti]